MQNQAAQRSALMMLGTFALSTVIFVYGFWAFLVVQPWSDFGEHIAYAERIESINDLTSPHFLFQLAINGVHAAGVTYVAATAWVLGLCYGGMAVLIAREIHRRGVVVTAKHAFLAIPAVLIASHVFLLTVSPPELYHGYFVPITYHSPTQHLNKLFALWISFAYCAQFLDRQAARTGPVMSIGGLTVLSALAKPSFLIAFLPTAGLVALAEIARRQWRQVLMFALGIALPATAVLLWQATVAYGSASGAGVIFAPFAVFDFGPTLYKLPASLAFPIVVAVIALTQRVRDPKFGFVWLYTAIALFMTLFLGEQGSRLGEGNFAWTGQTAVFLAYVESLLLLLTHPGLVRHRSIAWATFAVHVACGIIWYAAGFSPNWSKWQ